MTLFEDWYITYRSGPDIDVYDDLKLDQGGNTTIKKLIGCIKRFLLDKFYMRKINDFRQHKQIQRQQCRRYCVFTIIRQEAKGVA